MVDRKRGFEAVTTGYIGLFVKWRPNKGRIVSKDCSIYDTISCYDISKGG